MEARRELIEAVRERYREAERIEKKQILDKFSAMAGYHRTYAIARFVRRTRSGVPMQSLPSGARVPILSKRSGPLVSARVAPPQSSILR